MVKPNLDDFMTDWHEYLREEVIHSDTPIRLPSNINFQSRDTKLWGAEGMRGRIVVRLKEREGKGDEKSVKVEAKCLVWGQFCVLLWKCCCVANQEVGKRSRKYRSKKSFCCHLRMASPIWLKF